MSTEEKFERYRREFSKLTQTFMADRAGPWNEETIKPLLDILIVAQAAAILACVDRAAQKRAVRYCEGRIAYVLPRMRDGLRELGIGRDLDS